LCDHVRDGRSNCHATGRDSAKRYGRIDVAARYRTDAVGHADESKTERETDACKPDARGAVCARDHGCAAPQQYECECADEFGQWFFHDVSLYFPHLKLGGWWDITSRILIKIGEN